MEANFYTGTSNIIFNLDVSGDVDEILEEYNNYINQIVEIFKPPERNRIILSLNIIQKGTDIYYNDL